MNFQNTLEFAKELDQKDPLAKWRDQFYIPVINNKETLYFTGNSLGLQPKKAKKYIETELDAWAQWGVEGHFLGTNPWKDYHEMFANPIATIVGAKPEEVVVMNNLTVNLNLLMVSFYQPKGKRVKIICEAKAFPSDQYALEMQVRHHGLNPDEVLVEVAPRDGEYTIRHEDIIAQIEAVGAALALVMIGGVNYFTGQVFDMKAITDAGHQVGAMVGFDLAHGAGNIELKLHDWEVDFACWCSYKYMNSGPGGVSGIYVNEKHCKNPNLVRFAGWWGHDKDRRFLMEKGFKPMPTAESWQMSNAPVMTMAIHKASLDIFTEVGMPALLKKQKELSGYLEFIIDAINATTLKGEEGFLNNITPRNWEERGCQISIVAEGYGKSLFDHLIAEGVITDWREPNVIRLAPVPLYNSFEDVYRFGMALVEAL